ncbi:hypothetical protein Tfont_01598 [Tepidimonas fonticaldi]|uniref:Uncharacterized protein n=1 Tax=Tepidimonas fonticaldi TaxID=1101373 RepID=A0A554XM53_9BURK|nr:transcriptional regulator [Tepidimonas fonticaldi]TSE36886.1 hypothetical protein Tfont_01598 [Tepidimonas fonticaldi]
MNTAGCVPSPHHGVVVVVIAEAELESVLCDDILAAGAKGYTVSEVRGRGNRGLRDDRLLLSNNVRFEVLCDESTARSVLDAVLGRYGRHYGIVAYALPTWTPP